VQGEKCIPLGQSTPLSSAVVDEDDLLKSGWVYLDSMGQRQGPFSTREMAAWYLAGFFPDTTSVRRVSATAFAPIGTFPELKRMPAPTRSFPVPSVPMPGGGAMPLVPVMASLGPAGGTPGAQVALASGGADYAQRANFTRYQGRFTHYDETTHFTARGLAADKEGRDMGKFMDADGYQESMLQRQEAGLMKKRPPKLTKAQVEFFKQRRRLQKVRKILADDE